MFGNLPFMFSHLPDTTLAYAAGLMDGEGHITMQRRNASPLRHPLIVVANTELALTQVMSQNFGGYTSLQKARGNSQPCHFWRLYGDPAVDCLTALFPYLLDSKKRARAQFLISGWPAVRGAQGRAYSEAQLEARLAFEQAFKQLPTQRIVDSED